jgi:2-oxo-3-hexenedioate decarboxylase
MDKNEILKTAKTLNEATMEIREIERLTLTFPEMTLDDAYLIQDAGIAIRLARGERQVGFKMGLTSKAKREQMNLTTPIYGVLTDTMRVQEDTAFSLKYSLHAKIEPEIAFLIDKELKGPVSRNQIIEACSGVCSAMEIIDSRFLNFKYFSLPDVVADNCSSSYFVLSSTVKKINDLDLENLEMDMKVNGETVQKASSKEISGNPINSLVQLCEMLHSRGITLPAGSIVLAGAATQAVALTAGTQILLTVENLGSVGLRVGLE